MDEITYCNQPLDVIQSVLKKLDSEEYFLILLLVIHITMAASSTIYR